MVSGIDTAADRFLTVGVVGRNELRTRLQQPEDIIDGGKERLTIRHVEVTGEVLVGEHQFLVLIRDVDAGARRSRRRSDLSLPRTQIVDRITANQVRPWESR